MKPPSPETVRVRIISVTWILSVLLAVAALLFFVFPPPTAAAEPVEYVLHIPSVPEVLLPHLRKGDELTDRKTGDSLGEVTAVTYTPATEERFREQSGDVFFAEIPGRYDVTVTVRRSGEAPKPGTELSFRTPDYYGTGTVYGIVREG